MPDASAIPGFAGAVIGPSDDRYDSQREVWNAMVDHHPTLIAQASSAVDVAAAIRFAREHDLDIGVKCGGHSVLGLSVPDGGLMIDLSPMSGVRVEVGPYSDISTRRRWTAAWPRRRATCRTPASAA